MDRCSIRKHAPLPRYLHFHAENDSPVCRPPLGQLAECTSRSTRELIASHLHTRRRGLRAQLRLHCSKLRRRVCAYRLLRGDLPLSDCRNNWNCSRRRATLTDRIGWPGGTNWRKPQGTKPYRHSAPIVTSGQIWPRRVVSSGLAVCPRPNVGLITRTQRCLARTRKVIDAQPMDPFRDALHVDVPVYAFSLGSFGAGLCCFAPRPWTDRIILHSYGGGVAGIRFQSR